jgi:hypothetical protein
MDAALAAEIYARAWLYAMSMIQWLSEDFPVANLCYGLLSMSHLLSLDKLSFRSPDTPQVVPSVPKFEAGTSYDA